MKLIATLAASALALCVLYSAAGAMSTAPYSGQNPGTKFTPGSNGPARNPTIPYNGNDPYADASPLSPYGAPRPTGRRPERSTGQFLNVDPFDPNSVMNSYDRKRYANPYPYDPVYNPYGQSGNVYGTAPNMIPGQGMPYRP